MSLHFMNLYFNESTFHQLTFHQFQLSVFHFFTSSILPHKFILYTLEHISSKYM